MNYTTYLFDFDYTLADSSKGIVTCFQNVLKSHGYTEITDDAIKRTIGKTLEDSFSILTGVTDAEQLAEFKKEYRKEADVHMTVNTMLFLETKSVLIALKDGGARIGIISTKYRYRIKELLDQHFPSNFMDIIVGGEDVKAAKPSPEGLLYAIKQLHADKAETLYIGDSTVDAETAQAAGVSFAGVTHGVTTAKELAKYPHWKIMSTLEELLENEEEEGGREEKEKGEEKGEGEETVFKIENPIHPENAPKSRKKKKLISIWQILLLALFFWLWTEEYETTDSSYFFLTLFLLTLWGILQKRMILPAKVKEFIAPWWHPCAVRLRAFHIKLIRGKGTPATDNEICTCQNCGTTYTGNYCNRCGQSRNTPRYRLSNALRNIMGGFFNIDSGFARTLTELLYRPGYMIRDYIGGKRVQYFRPFQTLFVLAALYIMMVQLVDPEALNRKPISKQERLEQQTEQLIDAQKNIQKDLEKATTPEEKEALTIVMNKLDKQLKKTQNKLSERDSIATPTETTGESEDNGMIGVLVEEMVNGSIGVEARFDRFLQNSPFLMKVWNLMKGWSHGNKAFRIIAMLPLFALATQLSFRRRKYKLNYNTTEHVFIQAYIACQILLLSILVLPINGHAEVDDLYEVPLWLIFVLFCWDYKQLYRCTWWKSFWRTTLMLFYSLILLIIFAIFAVIMANAAYRLLGFLLP